MKIVMCTDNLKTSTYGSTLGSYQPSTPFSEVPSLNSNSEEKSRSSRR